MSGLSKGWYDFAFAFNTRAAKVHEWAKGKGFWGEDHNNNILSVPAKLCLIHSEISEAMEAHRKGQMDDHLKERLGLEVELADTVIRIMDLAAQQNLDLGMAIAEKMAYNQGRPYKHNKEY